MRLAIIRNPISGKPTMGKWFIDGKYFCFTLEDEDRGLDQEDELCDIVSKKVYGDTCIPYGTYNVQVTYSPKFKRNLPAITPVKGFEGIRVHRGFDKNSTLGCVTVGFQCTARFTILESKKAEEALIAKLGTDIHQLVISKQ